MPAIASHATTSAFQPNDGRHDRGLTLASIQRGRAIVGRRGRTRTRRASGLPHQIAGEMEAVARQTS